MRPSEGYGRCMRVIVVVEYESFRVFSFAVQRRFQAENKKKQNYFLTTLQSVPLASSH